jgi:hypothetical protein
MVISSVFLLLQVCSTGTDDSSIPDVYISGATLNDQGVMVPCYWKNGVRTDLSQINPSLSGVGTSNIYGLIL